MASLVRKFLPKSRSGRLHELERVMRSGGDPSRLDRCRPLSEQPAALEFKAHFELNTDRLSVDEKVVLGEGCFGHVVLGRLSDLYQLEMLLSEAKVLMHVGHHLNIVNLLGVDASSLPGLLVVMEYCRHGSLKRFLNEHRLQGAFVQGGCEPASQGFRHCGMVLSSDELVSMSYQLADALDYLAKRRIVHRDVAARNVLVADDLVVKLCDFGMARSLGDVTHCAHTTTQSPEKSPKRSNSEPLPIKWLAPERVSASRGTLFRFSYSAPFSIESDVWSFGVLLWEVFTLGFDPYAERRVDQVFIDQLLAGTLPPLTRPTRAPATLYEIMVRCWRFEPLERPTFEELRDDIYRYVGRERLRSISKRRERLVESMQAITRSYASSSSSGKTSSSGDYLQLLEGAAKEEEEEQGRHADNAQYTAV